MNLKNIPYWLKGSLIFLVLLLLVKFVPPVSIFLMMPYVIISMPAFLILSILPIYHNETIYSIVFEILLFVNFFAAGAIVGLIYAKLKARKIRNEIQNKTSWFSRLPILLRVLIITWIVSIIFLLPLFLFWSCMGFSCLGGGILLMPVVISSYPIFILLNLAIKNFVLDSNPPLIIFVFFVELFYYTLLGLFLGIIIQKHQERKQNNINISK